MTDDKGYWGTLCFEMVVLVTGIHTGGKIVENLYIQIEKWMLAKLMISE